MLEEEVPVRKYPITEPLDPSPNTNPCWPNYMPKVTMTMTTYESNPFHGVDRYFFAFDEWAHRHHLNSRGPLHWFCTWWDKRLLGE